MKAEIIVNGYIRLQSQINQAERIKEELTALGVQTEVVKNFPEKGIEGGRVPSRECDFCVFLDKDRAAANLIERAGVRLFNRARGIEICDDKMLTHIALSGCGIDMPDSIYAPLCYYADEKPKEGFLRTVERELGFPLVAKICYGSRGEGVTLVNTFTELYSYERENITVPHFYQKFIDCGCGRDVRAIVIGGKFVCAMERVNEKDFRSNVAHGGKGYKYAADEDFKALCERTADILQLDYCGIDVLVSKEGRRYVCEVNSNAFFEEAERVCGVNIAGEYARHMLKIMGC